MNRLLGLITGVERSGHLASVDIAFELEIYGAIVVTGTEETPYLTVGKPILMLFKETEVSLAKNLSGDISLRNRIPATVQAIEYGALLSAVNLDYRGQKIVSVITTRSVKRLALAIGDAVEGLIKANELTLVDPSAR